MPESENLGKFFTTSDSSVSTYRLFRFFYAVAEIARQVRDLNLRAVSHKRVVEKLREACGD